MIKGTRPSKHPRMVRYGKNRAGRRLKIVNPSISKKLKPITNKQYRKTMMPFQDADGDGKRNIDDCRPFDKKKK